MSRTRLFWDIETLPIILVGWRTGKQYATYEHIIQGSSICCVSWRWDHENRTYTKSILDYPSKFRSSPYDDAALIQEVYKTLSRAPLAIAHNGDGFDLKVFRTRCLIHKLRPFRVQTFDTLKSARKEFRFDSSKLDHISGELGHGHKEKTGGLDLWKDIIGSPYMGRTGKILAQAKSAMRRMIKYNRRDVELLQKDYFDMAPWASQHPNVSLMLGQVWSCCPKCQSKDIVKYGFRCAQTGSYQRWICKSCGNPWMTERTTDKPRPEIKVA